MEYKYIESNEDIERRKRKIAEAKRNLEGILQDWCDTAGVTTPISYIRNMGLIRVFTDNEDKLRGENDCLFKEFQNRVQDEYGYIYKIEIIELTGVINFIEID